MLKLALTKHSYLMLAIGTNIQDNIQVIRKKERTKNEATLCPI